jgi:hypothetical protein
MMVTVSHRPVEGSPVGLTLFGSTVYVWWGPDANGTDCVEAADGLAMAWATVSAAWATAEASNWSSCDAQSANEAPVMDLTPAHEWLRSTRASPDASASLNLWNIAADIPFSTGHPWVDRGRSRDVCYDKLVAASVPWLFGRDAYAPRWTARELSTLRDVLGHAIHVLRAGVCWDTDSLQH